MNCLRVSCQGPLMGERGLVFFEAAPNGAQGLLLALSFNITPRGAWEITKFRDPIQTRQVPCILFFLFLALSLIYSLSPAVIL